MADKKDITRSGRAGEVNPEPSAAGMIESFLSQAKQLGFAGESGRTGGRLIFALDATMSRQPTWDLACRVQGEMFEIATAGGSLSGPLVHFRGFGPGRRSPWAVE